MNDTMTVREACIHGYYVKHAMLTRTVVPVDSHQEMVGEWKQSRSCPGGKEIILRRPDSALDMDMAAKNGTVYVEVDINE